jgi:hypothetical protein
MPATILNLGGISVCAARFKLNTNNITIAVTNFIMLKIYEAIE